MQHPILASTSILTGVPARNLGSLALSPGVRHLGPVPMVTLTTKGGQTLTCTPETIFALAKKDGCPVLFHAQPKNWAPLWDVYFELQETTGIASFADFLGSSESVRFLRGLILACGTYTARESIPAQIVLQENEDNATLLDDIKAWLLHVQEVFDLRNRNGQPWGIYTAARGGKLILACRIMDQMVEGVLDPVTKCSHDLFSTHESHLMDTLAGILAGMDQDEDGRRFVHRSAAEVRQLHQVLMNRGFPVALQIHPLEREMTVHARRINHPHTLFIDNHRLYDLARWNLVPMNERFTPEEPHDPIISVENAGEHNATELSGDGAGYVNGLRVNLTFTAPEVALEIATMPQLFVDVAEPERVLQDAPAHLTHKFGEL